MACTPAALMRLMQRETTDLNNLRHLVSTYVWVGFCWWHHIYCALFSPCIKEVCPQFVDYVEPVLLPPSQGIWRWQLSCWSVSLWSEGHYGSLCRCPAALSAEDTGGWVPLHTGLTGSSYWCHSTHFMRQLSLPALLKLSSKLRENWLVRLVVLSTSCWCVCTPMVTYVRYHPIRLN